MTGDESTSPDFNTSAKALSKGVRPAERRLTPGPPFLEVGAGVN
jgi:hypothetical protein